MPQKMSGEDVLFGYIREALHAPLDASLPITSSDLDDCALLKIDDTRSLAITSDFVRGSGFTMFKLGLMDYFDVGYYLVAANLSDLASCGAKPSALTTVIRYGDEMGDENFKQVFAGMRAAADPYGARIIGGDVGGYVADVFAATAFGFVDTDKALLRKNVQDDDVLCVTGNAVGRPVTAQLYFRDAKPKGFTLTEAEENDIRDAWRRPQARVREGLLLSQSGIGNAAQDVSDGLKATIEQMAQLSGKNFTLFEDKIPLHSATKKLAEFLGVDPLQIAISASVDFELLFTIPRTRVEECQKLFAAQNLNMHVIGEVNQSGENNLRSIDGSTRALPGTTWKQQSGNFLADIVKRS